MWLSGGLCACMHLLCCIPLRQGGCKWLAAPYVPGGQTASFRDGRMSSLTNFFCCHLMRGTWHGSPSVTAVFSYAHMPTPAALLVALNLVA